MRVLNETGFEVCAEARTGAEAVELAASGWSSGRQTDWLSGRVRIDVMIDNGRARGRSSGDS